MKRNAHTNRRRSDWLFIIANWQSHENFVFVLWHAFYILFAFASGFWEFSEITQNFPTHGRYRSKWYVLLAVMRNVLCFVFALCLFSLSTHCFVLSVDRRGHRFPKGMQYRLEWHAWKAEKQKTPSSAFVYIDTPSEQERKKNKGANQQQQQLFANKYTTIYDISPFCWTSEK